MVEHNLAKVGVASSSLVSRSIIEGKRSVFPFSFKAGWQNGHAAACKAVEAGSIPAPASNLHSIDDIKALVAGKRDYRAGEAVRSLGRARLPAWPVDAAGEGVGRMSWDTWSARTPSH